MQSSIKKLLIQFLKCNSVLHTKFIKHSGHIANQQQFLNMEITKKLFISKYIIYVALKLSLQTQMGFSAEENILLILTALARLRAK